MQPILQSRLIYFALIASLLSACAENPGTDSAPSPDDSLPGAQVDLPKRVPKTYSFGTTPEHPALESEKAVLASAANLDARIEIQEGDRIEVWPKKLIRHERVILRPLVLRTPRLSCSKTGPTCVANEPIYQSQCDDQCHSCVKCTFVGCFPWRCCDSVCQNVKIGDRCIATEDRCVKMEIQWLEQSVYLGLGEPKVVEDPEPMKSAAFLREGLYLKLSLRTSGGSGGPVVDCPLDHYKIEADGQKLGFIFEKSACSELGPVPDSEKLFALVLANRMVATVPYWKGLQEKDESGKIIQNAEAQSYAVPVTFVGDLTVSPAPAP